MVFKMLSWTLKWLFMTKQVLSGLFKASKITKASSILSLTAPS